MDNNEKGIVSLKADVDSRIPVDLYADGKPRTYEEIEAAYSAAPFHDENERTHGMILQFYNLLEGIIDAVRGESVVNGEEQWEIVEPFAEKIADVADRVAEQFSQYDRKQSDGEQDIILQPFRKEITSAIRSFFPAADEFLVGVNKLIEGREDTGNSFPLSATVADYWGPVRTGLAKAHSYLDNETGRKTVDLGIQCCTHMVLIGDRMHKEHGMDDVLPKRAPGKDILLERSQQDAVAFALRP